MDLASIMLITSSCGNYGLLGRKKSWPKGRYSTLAGFAEVGETIEDCCIRETLEESGVIVDPTSVTFVASQPWPFPQSLMVGFRGRAYPQEQGLPRIEVNVDEMENVQWFSREYVRERLEGGSSALGYNPTTKEEEFHIPGRSSLARLLITQWANE
jgi:NAD+ diphosphatase